MSRDNSHLSQKFRLVFVINSNAVGGTEHYLSHLITHLRSRHTITLICSEHPALDSWIEKFFPLNIRVIRVRFAMIRRIQHIIRIIRIFRNADIVHFVLPCPARNRLEMICAFFAGVPARIATSQLVTAPDSKLRIRNLYTRLSVRLAYATLQKIIAVSHHCKAQLTEFYQTGNRKIEVVYNAVAMSSNNATSPLSVPAHYAKRYIIAVIGRLHPQKGQRYLVEAAPQIIAGFPGCHFIFIGDGPDKAYLESLIHKKGISGYFSLAGHQPDVPALLKNIDLLVMPSLAEGFPFTLLEAMAAGVPVVASDIGGINECIEHQVSGMLIPAGNSSSLADTVLHLIHHPGAATKMGQRGKQRVAQLFALEGMIEKTMRIMTEVITTN